MRIRNYTEAVRFANSAGLDAAKRRMRNAGRKVMSATDYNYGVSVTEKFLVDLGYDIPGWIAMAGLPRNEPPPVKAKRKPRRATRAEPVQLRFAFA